MVLSEAKDAQVCLLNDISDIYNVANHLDHHHQFRGDPENRLSALLAITNLLELLGEIPGVRAGIGGGPSPPTTTGPRQPRKRIQRTSQT
ncbi:hypothetical protein BST13_12690 [Mycobacterium aquaticum]|uniref:Uncharacterized protein n=1 Tax=Mycobacterium aquaticum TaxID=1927124 RepID=A0A1X0B0K9_9MYCO|nr:hypothetical protein BST13_12690 [Mycobacterium aquaticum]